MYIPRPEYPRPTLVRGEESWLNLNGKWEFAFDFGNSGRERKMWEAEKYEKEILVPFVPESKLSGIEYVDFIPACWYRRTVELPKEWNREAGRVLIHFGAVDYYCEIRINGNFAGSHKGGYTPFTFDVTPYILDGENDLRLEVKDPTQTGSQARGKQTFKRGGIWYTPQSGIWQTVWIEEVCEGYIESIKLTPDIDNDELQVEVKYNGPADAEMAAIALEKGTVMNGCKLEKGKGVIKLSDYECWSPENPVLYDLKIVAGNDQVESYFGMRKFSVGEDENGTPRFMLNNKPYFFNGLLDQGYWSDGMYTAPHDDALIYDIQTMKDLGFNTLRKHIKIEPLRWYYHCDRLGMIVWQDMINGGGAYNFLAIGTLPFFGMLFSNKKIGHVNDSKKHFRFYARTDEKGREEYFKDSEEMIDLLYNVPSLALWTPFNEAWGQFESAKACEFYRKKDPTRLIDHASGWADQGAGDVNSFHIYFTPFWFPKYNKDDNRPIALTEFGGYSIQPKGHMYNKSKFFGYRKYYDQEKFDDAIRNLYENRILNCIKEKGLSAIIYTEVSDVEDECNGLLSYDREVIKITPEVMKDINSKIKL